MPITLGHDPYELLGLPQEQPMGEQERALFHDFLARRRRNDEFGYDMAAQQVGYGMQGQMLDARLAAQQEHDARQLAAYDARQQAQQQAIDERQQLGQEQQQIRQLENSPFTQPLSNQGLPSPQQVQNTQQQIQQNQIAAAAPVQEHRQRLMDSIYRGEPMAIQAGVQQGILRFTPEQEAERTRLQASLGKIDAASNLNPLQKAQARRQQLERLNRIQPQFAPQEQVPLTPEQRFQQEVTVQPDPVTNQPTAYVRDRSGVLHPLEPSAQQQSDIKVRETLQIEEGKAALGLQTRNGGPKPASVREHVTSDPEAYNKLYDSVQKALIKPGNKEEGTVDTLPSGEEIEAEMNRRIELQEKMQREFQQRLNTPPPGMNIFGGAQGGFTPNPTMPARAQQQSSLPFGPISGSEEEQQVRQHNAQQAAQPQQSSPTAAPPVQRQTSQQMQPLSPEWFASEPGLKPLADEYAKMDAELANVKSPQDMEKLIDKYPKSGAFQETLKDPLPMPADPYLIRDGAVYKMPNGTLWWANGTGPRVKLSSLPGV